MRPLTIVAATLVAASALPVAAGAATPVRVGSILPRAKLLKPGTHRYVRYRIQGASRTLVDIWTRTLSFERVNDRLAMRIKQRWDIAKPKVGGPTVLEQDSWFETGTFKPLTHLRRETRESAVVVKGYQFFADKVTGMADLPQNAASDFTISLKEPAFNFETDMELLQALPLATGYSADIVFYDAGIDPKADHYTFKVARAQDIHGWDGRPVHCWVVTADYNTGKVRSRFWFDQISQVMVREEIDMPDGTKLVKALLPPESDS